MRLRTSVTTLATCLPSTVSTCSPLVVWRRFGSRLRPTRHRRSCSTGPTMSSKARRRAVAARRTRRTRGVGVGLTDARHRPQGTMGAMHVLACADKFRGTLTASEFGEAVAAGAEGHEVVIQPLADGGEGTLDAFGGPNRRTTVTGPLGDPVDAAWRLSGGRAVIEMARASGLSLVGGADGNDPLEATTAGTGELIAKAVEAARVRSSSGWVARRPPTGSWRTPGPACTVTAAGGGSGRRLRRRDALHGRSSGVRAAEGCECGSGSSAHRSARTPGRRVPVRARGRCCGDRGWGSGGWTRWWSRRCRGSTRVGCGPDRRRRRPVRQDRGRRPRRHR